MSDRPNLILVDDQQLWQARTSLRLSQERLGVAAGVSWRTVWRIENNSNTVRRSTFEKLARILGPGIAA